MLIKELPIQIQELALRRQKEYGNLPNIEGNLKFKSSSFSWMQTPEGHDFWSKIKQGNFKGFYEIHPKIEVTEELKEEAETLFAFFKS